MTYKEVIDMFLDSQVSDTKAAYRKKIYSFYDYTIEEKDATDSNFDSVLKNLNIEEIMQSVRYYVRKNEIIYISSSDLYIATVRSFFQYIALKFKWCNPYFEEKTNAGILTQNYKETISELNLKGVQRSIPINDAQANEIIKICNQKIEEADYDELVKGKYNGIFSNYISAIISKLVIYYGSSNNTIRNLRMEDYNREFGKLRINGYEVHLFDTMKVQMDQYMAFREKIAMESSENKALFIDFANPQKKKLDNTMMFFILKGVIGTNQGTALAKYAIIKMIEDNIPAYLIKEFTGYKNDIYNHCQELLDDQMGPASKQDKEQRIDASVIKRVTIV